MDEEEKMSVADTSNDLEALIGVHPEEALLKFFRFSHLPEKLRLVSRDFANLALIIVGDIPRSAERTVALRKLLEGKDAAVRACL